jgi:hypothetical protein
LREPQYDDAQSAGIPFDRWYPRAAVRTPDGWIVYNGRRYYRETPPTYDAPRPRRRGFLDELFGTFDPSRR